MYGATLVGRRRPAPRDVRLGDFLALSESQLAELSGIRELELLSDTLGNPGWLADIVAKTKAALKLPPKAAAFLKGAVKFVKDHGASIVMAAGAVASLIPGVGAIVGPAAAMVAKGLEKAKVVAATVKKAQDFVNAVRDKQANLLKAVRAVKAAVTTSAAEGKKPPETIRITEKAIDKPPGFAPSLVPAAAPPGAPAPGAEALPAPAPAAPAAAAAVPAVPEAEERPRIRTRKTPPEEEAELARPEEASMVAHKPITAGGKV
jgi:hypothetical protein